MLTIAYSWIDGHKRWGAFEEQSMFVALPLHLWDKALFKYLGDCYGCFVAMDDGRCNLQPVRILVS